MPVGDRLNFEPFAPVTKGMYFRQAIKAFFVVVGVIAFGLPGICAEPIYTFDARSLHKLDNRDAANATRVWDTMHLLGALQGLANREQASFYIFCCSEFERDTDQFWFDWLRGEDGWMAGRTVIPLSSVESALNQLRTCYSGLVVYDPAVPATSDVASTIAGCDSLLPVRYDRSATSLYSTLVRMGIPVKRWLINENGTSLFTGKGIIPGTSTPSSGSTKVDAYRWAVYHYLKSGKCGSGIATYYIDSAWTQHADRGAADLHTLSNHDYFIARRAFFFDLSPWGDETPNDDAGQTMGLDRAAFLAIMQGLYDRAGGHMIKVGGFPPWPFKYTAHSLPAGKHEGVPTEWEFGRLISQYNGYMEADAPGLSAMANASFFAHYPLKEHYQQPNPKPNLADWKSRGYVGDDGHLAKKLFVAHYVGDYDSPAWLYRAVPRFFSDPARGRIPLGWAFDPNLADRAPQVFAYVYRHATKNDFFITGDCGAGYLNVRALTYRPDSRLMPGLETWRRHCKEYYSRWDMSITGFILDGSAGASTATDFQVYREFSSDGMGTHYETRPKLYSGVPTCPERDLPDSIEDAAKIIAGAAGKDRTQAEFFWARSILKSPQWYSDLADALAKRHPDASVEFVDPYTFFGLIRLQLTPPR